MNLRHFFLISFFVFPVYMFAHLTGTYKVNGFDPATNQDYTGTLVITKNDSVYTALWTFPGPSNDIGTGVREDDFLSIAFNEDNGISFGTQLYEIDGDTLHGPWVRLGATEKGFEKAKKIDR